MGNIGAYASNAKLASENYIARQKKENKMGFFKRWLLKQVQLGYQHERENQDIVSINKTIEPRSIDQPERALQFTVYTASGGRVIETRKYNKQKDRFDQSLYIITNDQEFGREIDKIITLENLR